MADRDPLTRPVVRFVLMFEDGSEETRDYLMDESPPHFDQQPEWATGGTREWEHPQDPVTIRIRVQEGKEDEARKAVGLT